MVGGPQRCALATVHRPSDDQCASPPRMSIECPVRGREDAQTPVRFDGNPQSGHDGRPGRAQPAKGNKGKARDISADTPAFQGEQPQASQPAASCVQRTCDEHKSPSVDRPDTPAWQDRTESPFLPFPSSPSDGHGHHISLPSEADSSGHIQQEFPFRAHHRRQASAAASSWSGPATASVGTPGTLPLWDTSCSPVSTAPTSVGSESPLRAKAPASQQDQSGSRQSDCLAERPRESDPSPHVGTRTSSLVANGRCPSTSSVDAEQDAGTDSAPYFDAPVAHESQPDGLPSYTDHGAPPRYTEARQESSAAAPLSRLRSAFSVPTIARRLVTSRSSGNTLSTRQETCAANLTSFPAAVAVNHIRGHGRRHLSSPEPNTRHPNGTHSPLTTSRQQGRYVQAWTPQHLIAGARMGPSRSNRPYDSRETSSLLSERTLRNRAPTSMFRSRSSSMMAQAPVMQRTRSEMCHPSHPDALSTPSGNDARGSALSASFRGAQGSFDRPAGPELTRASPAPPGRRPALLKLAIGSTSQARSKIKVFALPRSTLSPRHEGSRNLLPFSASGTCSSDAAAWPLEAVKATCPATILTLLPWEILIKIIRELIVLLAEGHEDDVRSGVRHRTIASSAEASSRQAAVQGLISLASVNKTFRSLVLDGQLWRSIDALHLQSYGPATVLRVVASARSFVRALDLASLRTVSSAFLQKLTSRLVADQGEDFAPTNGLRKLNLSGMKHLSEECIAELLATSPNLTILDVSDLPQIGHWTLQCLSQWCPAIEELNISRCTSLNGDSVACWLSELSDQASGNFRSLKAAGLVQVDEHLMSLIATRLSNIQTLDLSYAFGLNDDCVASFTTYTGAIDPNHEEDTADRPYFELTARQADRQGLDLGLDRTCHRRVFRNLKHLCLSSTAISDRGCAYLSGGVVPNLEILELANNHRLRDSGVIQLLESLPQLRRLDLEGAAHLTRRVPLSLTAMVAAAEPTDEPDPRDVYSTEARTTRQERLHRRVDDTAGAGSQLTHLILSEVARVDDSIMALVESSPKLRHLEVDSTRVTDQFTLWFVEEMKARRAEDIRRTGQVQKQAAQVTTSYLSVIDCGRVTRNGCKDVLATGIARARIGQNASAYDFLEYGQTGTPLPLTKNMILTDQIRAMLSDECNEERICVKTLYFWHMLDRKERRAATKQERKRSAPLFASGPLAGLTFGLRRTADGRGNTADAPTRRRPDGLPRHRSHSAEMARNHSADAARVRGAGNGLAAVSRLGRFRRQNMSADEVNVPGHTPFEDFPRPAHMCTIM